MNVPHELPEPGPGAPTPAIALRDGGAAATARLDGTFVPVPPALADQLASICPTTVEGDLLGEASRDWWPQAMIWALDGQVAAKAAAVVQPRTADEVARVLALCNDARIPVTPAGGRSGVCGASVPVHGGVVLDLCAMSGIVEVDDTSLVLDVLPGTFGDHLEHELRSKHGLTVGHWPQSVALSTVGGWIACRGAGQLSGRYGKIEDMVLGLDVALADGRQISTGGAPRQAVGPDLNQVFVGSEGTLGVITQARLRLHPMPTHERRAAYELETFDEGLEVMRQTVRRGAHPAVFRLYDPAEADRTYHTGTHALLLVLDEGDAELVDTTMEIVAEQCQTALRSDDAHVEHWLERRNDVAALEALISRGYVVDTMEVVGRWRDLPAIYAATLAALSGVEGTMSASAHQSHSYLDGGCLYFTFAAKVEPDDRDRYYREVWDAGQRAVLHAGGALSHHHGVGLNRSRFVQEALGPAFDVLAATKVALDPHGILNPGKLGLPSRFGATGY